MPTPYTTDSAYYADKAIKARVKIQAKGMSVTLVKTTTGEVSEDFELQDPVEHLFPFYALFMSYKDKDWADSKVENFYAVQASDRYLVGEALSLNEQGVRPESNDIIRINYLGEETEFRVIRVQSLDLGGYPILYRQIQIRSNTGTNPIDTGP